MQDYEKILHSILIVSGSESFAETVRKVLPVKKFMAVDLCRNMAAARQRYFERYYDIVVINFPLPDEAGTEFAFDIAENGSAGVLVAVPLEVYEDVLDRVTDSGILTVTKPLQKMQLEKSIQLIMAIQNKIQRLEREVTAAHEKMEELRIVSKAKCYLVEKKHMTEEEAHRYIGKEAMNHGVSRKRIAERILED